MVIKETILREAVKCGALSKDETSKMFKVDRGTADAIFDFLVEKEDIIVKEGTAP